MGLLWIILIIVILIYVVIINAKVNQIMKHLNMDNFEKLTNEEIEKILEERQKGHEH